MTDLLYSCEYGKPCIEVLDRLTAADRSEREGHQDVADELRRIAARWALVHDYGNGAKDVA